MTKPKPKNSHISQQIDIIVIHNFNLKVSDPGKPFGQRNETVGETLQPDEDAVVKLVMTFQFGLDIVSFFLRPLPQLCKKRLDEPALVAGPKSLLTEFGIFHGLMSCVWIYLWTSRGNHYLLTHTKEALIANLGKKRSEGRECPFFYSENDV